MAKSRAYLMHYLMVPVMVIVMAMVMEPCLGLLMEHPSVHYWDIQTMLGEQTILMDCRMVHQLVMMTDQSMDWMMD